MTGDIRRAQDAVSERRPLEEAPRHPPLRGEISWLEAASVILRRRRTIVAVAILMPSVLVVGMWLKAPDWTARTSFMPQVAQDATVSRLSSLAGQFGFDITDGQAGGTPPFYAELIRSREILGQLALDTFEVADTAGWLPRGRVRGTIADIIEVRPREAVTRRAAAIRWLLNDAVSVATHFETNIVELSVTTKWASLSAEIASRILDLVNGFNLRTRQSQARAERMFVEGRLAEAGWELEAAENDLQRFLQANRTFQGSAELQFEHDRLQRHVAMRQQVYTSLVQAHEQARIAEVRNTPVITVVERVEEPAGPETRNLSVTVAIGLVFGIFLGVFAGLVQELVERRRRQDDFEYREVAALWRETVADVERVMWWRRPKRTSSR